MILTNPDSGSAWICRQLFAKTIDHVFKYSKTWREHPIVLVLDNHESHVRYDVLVEDKNSGIRIVTLPPSNKQQDSTIGQDRVWSNENLFW